MSRALVVLLHGVGSRGADLEGLGRIWAEQLPDLHFAAPDAPNAFDMGGPGRQWFSVKGVTVENRPARILAARAGVDAAIADAVKKAGTEPESDALFLAGFSQGAIMALDALASGRWPLAGVIAFSGRLGTPDPLAPLPGARALLVHGAQDPVIPARESADAEARLAARGVDVARLEIPGLGHAIAPEGARRGLDFIRAALPTG